MNSIRRVLVCLLIASLGSAVRAEDELDDMLLRKVISAYEIQPYEPTPPSFGPKERLGQALFFDPLLSGPQSMACATCHVRSRASGDGLPLAVGLGGKGIGKARLAMPEAFLIARNTLPLFNRGDQDFRDFFWDGRVQMGPGGVFESPLGTQLPDGFENLLAVASVFPLVEADEMLGHGTDRVPEDLRHGDLVTIQGVDNNYQKRALNAFQNIVRRLLGYQPGGDSSTKVGYRRLFHEAFPNTPLESITISHVGNALSAYINAAFKLRPSRWDQYVGGNDNALASQEKRGAIIFFGKGRCAICHSGNQFSDFLFHSLAVPQHRAGKHGAYVDYGRAAATGRAADRYLFRTPPLRNVSQTGPWGHNGAFKMLTTIIEHHINPIPVLYMAQQADKGQKAYTGRLLAARSETLSEIAALSDREIALLASFLEALTSDTFLDDSKTIPAEVPSGNNAFVPQASHE